MYLHLLRLQEGVRLDGQGVLFVLPFPVSATATLAALNAAAAADLRVQRQGRGLRARER